MLDLSEAVRKRASLRATITKEDSKVAEWRTLELASLDPIELKTSLRRLNHLEGDLATLDDLVRQSIPDQDYDAEANQIEAYQDKLSRSIVALEDLLAQLAQL